MSPVAQFCAHETVSPVHESVNDAHEFAGHVFGVQHVPEVPHVLPPGALLQSFVAPQFTLFPWQSVTVPQEFAPHVVAPGHATLSPQAFFTVPHWVWQIAGWPHGVHPWRMFPQPSETPPPGSHTPGVLHVMGVQPHVFVAWLHGSLALH